MSKSPNPHGYLLYCKHCGIYPPTEGPHHKKRCPRLREALSITSDLANSYKCRFCGVKPFAAGRHHKESCRRYLAV